MAAPARWTIPHEDPILTSSDDPLVLPIRNYEAREQSVDHLLGHTSNDAEQILWESCGKWLYLACNHCQTNPWNICWNVWIWCWKHSFLPTASWTVGRHTQGSTLRFVHLSNPTYLSFGQVELTAWLPSFKYQYTRKKFLYQPRKWFFNQPARKLSVDPWIHCSYSRPHAWYWVDVLGPRVQKWWCMDRQLLVRECCKEVDRQTPPPTCKRASAWTLWDPGRYTGTRVMSIQSQYLRTSIANLVSW